MYVPTESTALTINTKLRHGGNDPALAYYWNITGVSNLDLTHCEPVLTIVVSKGN